MAEHSLLSPSSSHRWLNCTVSAMLEKNVPNEGSDFTKEGTLAHAFCARGLKVYLGINTKAEDKEIEELIEQYYTADMMDHVEAYTNIVLDKLEAAKKVVKDSELRVETKLDFSKWAPESFGTADAIIITDGKMEVIDFKYGKGVEVSADHNTQMMIYALGALDAFQDEYNIDSVRMTIVQPRLSNLSEFEMSVKDLLEWAKTELMPKAKLAIAGAGEQIPGDWCKFCRVKNQCQALAQECISEFDQFKDPLLISAEDFAKFVLPKIDLVKSWASSMEDYALQQALNGTHYEGYKIVEGRSNRKISDPVKAAEVLTEKGFTDCYKPKELKTITDLEKMCGKKAFTAIMGDLLVKPQGKPTLVPESDNRPAFNAVENDFNGIAD